MSEPYDLGSGFSYEKYKWEPDRDINPHFEGFQDIPWAGIILICRHGVKGAVSFITYPGHPLFTKGHSWVVECWDPLTLSPAIKRDPCGCNGYIKQGRWIDVSDYNKPA